MTYRHGRYFSRHLAHLATVLPLIAVITLCGCSTASDEGAPMALGEGPANTGTFPNLNVPQQAAAPQLSSDETATKIAALRRAQQGQTGPTSYETSEQRRKRLQLIGEEQDETLKVIENN